MVANHLELIAVSGRVAGGSYTLFEPNDQDSNVLI